MLLGKKILDFVGLFGTPFLKTVFLFVNQKMRVPLNFSLFGTPVCDFILKNWLGFLVGPMPFFKRAWPCFGLFWNQFHFLCFITLAFIFIMPITSSLPYRWTYTQTSLSAINNLLHFVWGRKYICIHNQPMLLTNIN